ncbi:hypothetical protein [Chryseobacterium sp.]|uniref:hypothetical protein n=1 Tax=Chryseobacterium sp. TaxID=1871047 RepID=UPI0028A0CCFC|nr:hypothetical protein [Chryseobacterium sp.]
MKNMLLGASIVLAFTASCADKKENREEFKAEHNKDSLRNTSADSAVANSQPTDGADSARFKTDTTQKPTNYESTPPNTQGGGSR